MCSTMSQERLNALDLISIENEFPDNIDYESVMNLFIKMLDDRRLGNSNPLTFFFEKLFITVTIYN